MLFELAITIQLMNHHCIIFAGKRRNKTRTEPNMSRIKSLETRPEKIEQINTAVDKIIFRYFAETAASSFQMKIPYESQ